MNQLSLREETHITGKQISLMMLNCASFRDIRSGKHASLELWVPEHAPLGNTLHWESLITVTPDLPDRQSCSWPYDIKKAELGYSVFVGWQACRIWWSEERFATNITFIFSNYGAPESKQIVYPNAVNCKFSLSLGVALRKSSVS